MAPKLRGLEFSKHVKEFVVRKNEGGGEFLYVYKQGRLAVRGKREILDVLRNEGVYNKLKDAQANRAALALMSEKEFESLLKKNLAGTLLVNEDHADVQSLTLLSAEQVKEKYANVHIDEDIIFEEEVMVDKPRRVKPEEEKEAMETLPEVDLEDENMDANNEEGSQEIGHPDSQQGNEVSQTPNAVQAAAVTEMPTRNANSPPKNAGSPEYNAALPPENIAASPENIAASPEYNAASSEYNAASSEYNAASPQHNPFFSPSSHSDSRNDPGEMASTINGGGEERSAEENLPPDNDDDGRRARKRKLSETSETENDDRKIGLEGTEFFAKYLADDLENPRVVSVTGIPKAAKEDDIKRFFSQFKEIEDFFQLGRPRYRKAPLRELKYLVAFSTREEARAFIKQKVMYGNVELKTMSRKDHYNNAMIRRLQEYRLVMLRFILPIEQYIRANIDLFVKKNFTPRKAKEDPNGADLLLDLEEEPGLSRLVLVSGFKRSTSHQKVLAYSKKIDNLVDVWRLECVPEKASSDNQFLGIYVMSFNTAANAAQFVSETRHFEDGENDENMTTITLTCLPWSDVRKHISVDLRPDNFVDLDKEANKELRAVLVIPLCNQTDLSKELKKSLKSVTKVYLCPAAKWINSFDTHNKSFYYHVYLITFKNNMAARDKLSKWVPSTNLIKQYRIYSLSTYLKFRDKIDRHLTEKALGTNNRTKHVRQVNSRILFYKGPMTSTISTMTEESRPRFVKLPLEGELRKPGTGNGRLDGDYRCVVVCRWPEKKPADTHDIRSYMKDNHPMYKSLFQHGHLVFIRFQSMKAADEFRHLQYVCYKGEEIKRYWLSECQTKEAQAKLNDMPLIKDPAVFSSLKSLISCGEKERSGIVKESNEPDPLGKQSR